MKEILYRNSTLSLVITNIWSIVGFFIFYFEDKGFMHGFITLIFYMYSSWIASGLGILMILVQKLYCKKEKYKLNFYSLYLVVGILNCFFSVIFISLIMLEIIELEALFTLFFFINFLVSFYIYFDISKNLKENRFENIKT